MARGRKPRTWVKLDCQGILGGSINYLLPLDGQAVWVKMICLSEVCGGRPGFIEDNNQNGLPHEYIAHELHCPLQVLEDVLKRMGDDNAIKINGTGSIELVNFQHYQFSEYDRQKPYRDKKKLNLTPTLPDWLNKETWDAFLEMRKGKKATPTPHAIVLLINELEKFKLAGDDPNEVLNRSIMNGWKGVFPLNKQEARAKLVSPASGDRTEGMEVL